jgi:hypothetical protein
MNSFDCLRGVQLISRLSCLSVTMGAGKGSPRSMTIPMTLGDSLSRFRIWVTLARDRSRLWARSACEVYRILKGLSPFERKGDRVPVGFPRPGCGGSHLGNEPSELGPESSTYVKLRGAIALRGLPKNTEFGTSVDSSLH